MKSWRKTAKVLAALATVALSVQGPASAASPRFDPNLTRVFGNVKPDDPGCADPVTGCLTLYPNSAPYGAGYELGQLYIVGQVDNFTVASDGRLKVFVDVAVTDQVSTVSKTVTVQPVSDPSLGDQGLLGYFHAEIRVTELGSHSVSDSGGVTPLTVTLLARNAINSETATLPNSTYPDDIVVTKYATTGGDTFKPVLSKVTWPPANWCHFSSKGGQIPTFIFGNQNMGGEHNGDCGDFAPIPDFTWIFCIRETSQPHKVFNDFWYGVVRPLMPAPEALPTEIPPEVKPFYASIRDLCNRVSAQFGCLGTQNNPFRGNYCRDSEPRVVPSGHAVVSGQADDSNASYKVSEIADITIQMTQGDTVLREYRNIIREGMRAQWSFNMPINDFEPNFFEGDPYVAKVFVTDANGNIQTAQSDPITIYDW